MKILLVSTLKRRIGEDVFASRSRIIYQLGRELALRGHSVSLLGTGDSKIPGVTTIPVIDKGWVDQSPVENAFNRDIASLIKQSQMMISLQDQFDVIHNHTYPDFFPHSFEAELRKPLLSTLHALYDTYMDELIASFTKTHFVALSKAYKDLYQKATINHVIYNGVDTDLYAYKEQKGEYLLWLGRLPKAKNSDGVFMDPKGVRWAIQLAQKSGVPLKLYGVVEDKNFYETDVAPFLNDSIQWIGKVGSEQGLPTEDVVTLMQNAKAFLMTVNQHEPFGLVMAEAMSCGTPVIGWRRGSVPEVVQDGVTGFVVGQDKGIAGLVEAVGKLDQIDSKNCRKHVEENFTIAKMISEYENLYTELSTSK